jgi:hypothetical protein
LAFKSAFSFEPILFARLAFLLKPLEATMGRFSLALLALALGGSNAFAPQLRTPVKTALQGTTRAGPATLSTTDERSSYAEVSRTYRRTVFTHDDWVGHRSSNRFLKNLGNFWNSGVYKNIGREVGFATGIATILVVVNALLGGYTDLEGVAHAAVISGIGKLALPMGPFNLASPSLGLLLGTYPFVACLATPHFDGRSVLSHLFDVDHTCTQCSAPTLPTNVGTKRERTGGKSKNQQWTIVKRLVRKFSNLTPFPLLPRRTRPYFRLQIQH